MKIKKLILDKFHKTNNNTFENLCSNNFDDSFNPLLSEDFIQYEMLPEINKKILNLNTYDWECPICYDNLKKKLILCFPFECGHAYCFSCFKKLCYSTPYRKRFNIKCPMCRQSTDNDWNDKYKIRIKHFKVNDSNIKIYIPSD
jgi:hypothetical protein